MSNHPHRPTGISVIITAFNYADMLPEAIRSVLAQSYPAVETIVVDDGSTDNTREVVAAFGNRVRYLHQKNAGLSAARNTGIRAASHPFVAFLDADDTWLPEMLSTLMKTLDRLGPEFGLVACSSLKCDESGTIWRKTAVATQAEREVTFHDLALRNRFAADAVVARREILEAAGLFDTTLTSSEDRDMWLRLTNHCRVYVLPDPLVVVRVHSGSMSRNTVRMKENMRKVLRKAREAGQAPRGNFFFWARVYSFFHYQVAWMHHDAGEHWTAIRALLRSMLIWPFFPDPQAINENHLFRVRSLITFAFQMVRSANGKQQQPADGHATVHVGTSLPGKDG